ADLCASHTPIAVSTPPAAQRARYAAMSSSGYYTALSASIGLDNISRAVTCLKDGQRQAPRGPQIWVRWAWSTFSTGPNRDLCRVVARRGLLSGCQGQARTLIIPSDGTAAMAYVYVTRTASPRGSAQLYRAFSAWASSVERSYFAPHGAFACTGTCT